MGNATVLAVLLLSFGARAAAPDDLPRPPPMAPPTAAPPPPEALPAWPDADDEIEAAAEGSLETCELVAVPLGFVPGVGDVLDTVAGWACIVPAAMAVDYVAVHHGGRDSYLWQSGLALASAKLVGDLIELPVLALGIGGTVLYAVAATTLVVASGTPAFVPLAVGGGILVGYGAFELWRTAHERIPGLVFGVVYALTSRALGDEADVARARTRALVKPHLQGPVAAFALVSAASSIDVDFELVHVVPIVGPFAKANARAALAKERMRRFGRDVLGDAPREFATLDLVEDILSTTKASMQAGGQVLMLGGLALAAGSAAGSAWTMSQGGTPSPVDVVGIVGIVGMGTGVSLLVLSKVTDVIRPIALPVAYAMAGPLDDLAVDVE